MDVNSDRRFMMKERNKALLDAAIFLASFGFLALIITVGVMWTKCAEAAYLPAITNSQISAATMGRIDSSRYKDDFGVDIMFIQQKIAGDTRMVGIGSLSKFNGTGTGKLNAFILQPLGSLITLNFTEPANPELKKMFLDRISIIIGGGLDSQMESELGGGIQVDLDIVVGFFKKLGKRGYRGGVIFPFLKRTIHFGGVYEHRDLTDIHNENSINKIGIVAGFALASKEKVDYKNVIKELEKTKEELKKFKKEAEVL